MATKQSKSQLSIWRTGPNPIRRKQLKQLSLPVNHDALDHLLRGASGLESMVTEEDQVKSNVASLP